MKDDTTNVQYFKDAQALRQWFEKYHNQKDELWVGFYKKSTGLAGMDWSQSVDQALCFGWIDGIRKSVDGKRFRIRFTPRRPGSHWSQVNIDKMRVLKKEGLLQPEGLAAFKKRKEENSARASFEQKNVAMNPAYLKQFKAHPVALKYFNSQPPSYVKTCTHWVISAKKEETRQSRLDRLILCCNQGEHLPQYRWSSKNK